MISVWWWWCSGDDDGGDSVSGVRCSEFEIGVGVQCSVFGVQCSGLMLGFDVDVRNRVLVFDVRC